jgi:hypothetical protein
MIEKVSETYKRLFKIWADVYVPKLIFAPKWYKDDEDLKEGDLVYMKKRPDNKLDSAWVIGIVDQAIPSRDGKVRRVIVKYQNASEFPVPQLTDRAVRQLVKIFDVDEYVLQDDLAELMRRLDADKRDAGTQQADDDDDRDPQVVGSNVQSTKLNSNDFSVSGTWLQLPVPIQSSPDVVESGLRDVPVDQVGGWCQVPGLTVQNLPASSANLSQTEPDPTPTRNPHFYPSLLKKFMDTDLPVVDNTVSLEMAESFAMAMNQEQSYHDQSNDAEKMQGLMQMLSCTNMNLY